MAKKSARKKKGSAASKIGRSKKKYSIRVIGPRLFVVKNSDSKNALFSAVKEFKKGATGRREARAFMAGLEAVR